MCFASCLSLSLRFSEYDSCTSMYFSNCASRATPWRAGSAHWRSIAMRTSTKSPRKTFRFWRCYTSETHLLSPVTVRDDVAMCSVHDITSSDTHRRIMMDEVSNFERGNSPRTDAHISVECSASRIRASYARESTANWSSLDCKIQVVHRWISYLARMIYRIDPLIFRVGRPETEIVIDNSNFWTSFNHN